MEQLEVGIESTEEECCQDRKSTRDHQVGSCEQEYIIESNHKSQASWRETSRWKEANRFLRPYLLLKQRSSSSA